MQAILERSRIHRRRAASALFFFLFLPGLLILAGPTSGVAGSWRAGGSMATAREYHTATLLPSGQVLVAGGDGGGSAFNSAELYDPVKGTWTTTGSLITAREWHTATLLPNGKVLVAGGGDNRHHSDQRRTLRPSQRDLERHRPYGHGPYFTRPPCCPTGRSWWPAAINSSDVDTNSAELYDPVRNLWTATGSTHHGP